MKIDVYGQPVYTEQDVFDELMCNPVLEDYGTFLVENILDIDCIVKQYQEPDVDVEEFHRLNQQQWFMTVEYKNLDIAKYILDLCTTDSELQRVGEELLLYQERDLFDLLRYLVYLVDIMRANNIIWGVGRGSSVASYVLYLIGIHRVNSMYYDLDPREFLR
jgi:DNA polymerase III alpha subunit